jgi:hypothetical protein
MNLKFFMALVMTIALISCGGGSDGDKKDKQQQETTGSSGTTGTSGTTGSSGTSGTTGGTTASCLTNTQKENIRDYLNRVSDLRTFTGVGTETIREADGTNTVNAITGTFDYVQSDENTWIANASICRAAPSTLCFQKQIVYAFKNGCLNVNGVRAKLSRATDSSLSFSYFDVRSVNERSSIATGKFTYLSSESKNRVTTYTLDFKEQ